MSGGLESGGLESPDFGSEMVLTCPLRKDMKNPIPLTLPCLGNEPRGP